MAAANPPATGFELVNSETLLRRFCFLGSFDCVYIHLRIRLKVGDDWERLKTICKELDNNVVLPIFRAALIESTLVRRDETLLAYATYLASEALDAWRTAMRRAFPVLIQTDDDLFLFCKYSMLIRNKQNKKGFSRTVRKAVIEWYGSKQPEEIRNYWLMHRGAHGYTHKVLIKLCHVTDDSIGAVGHASPYFKKCMEMVNEFDADEAVKALNAVPEANVVPSVDAIPAANAAPAANVVPAANAVPAAPNAVEAINISESPIISMSKLRITKNKEEALRIIRHFRFRFGQVPAQWLRFGPIMEEVIPTMSYMQLLKFWRRMCRLSLFQKPNIFRLCKKTMNEKNLRKDNIHPLTFLLQLNKIGVRGDLDKLSPKRVEAMRLQYLQDMYVKCFGRNKKLGLRMHITVNMQASYKKKHLRNFKKLSFQEAAVAMAFGYYKAEDKVDVYHWTESKLLEQIPWSKDMSVDSAIACCDKIQLAKHKQQLIDPYRDALRRSELYDVFVCIVPTAGRSNPKQTSTFLSQFLLKYRQQKNPKAKMIIVDLMKFKKSMSYSQTHRECILEICGIDEHTTDIIENFALDRFY